ncbi:MAG TPA: response regulator [Usitatibacter sp.]|nr:response regulator [Usitatibacter sp.]
MIDGALLLNVDDDQFGRYVKTRILRQAGFEVMEAVNGAEALALLKERPPALVLLDVKLPDINGREICERVKADPDMAGVVVLQTSASHVQSRDRIASLEAGADGYLIEPIEPEELVANVRALLRMRKAERERQRAIEELREADRRKDEFLAMLGHELRNPLAPIRNAVEILKSDDAQLRERARQMIGRQVAHLARLVDDLLEVSRITQGKVALRHEEVTLGSVIDSAVETVRATIESRGQSLQVHVRDPAAWIYADSVRLSQVVGNLLQNATKFTPPGGRIAVAARAGADGIEIVVEDNGAGMAPALLPRVFELFTQAERTLDRTEGGLGIGLSLVKGLVALHGGSVRAESEGRGHGSRFVVTLPASLLREAPADVSADEGANPVRASRVLVVEDNVDSAEAMRMLLERMGHAVSIVNDGALAMQAARAGLPEVIVLDIGLPGIDGYELARRMRADPLTRGAYLIAMSGYGQERDRQRSREAGFDIHLVKPVDPAQLEKAIVARP